jgi:hypothetical protein
VAAKPFEPQAQRETIDGHDGAVHIDAFDRGPRGVRFAIQAEVRLLEFEI